MGRIIDRRRVMGSNLYIKFADPAMKAACVALWGGADGGTAPFGERKNRVKVKGKEGEITYEQAESIIRIKNSAFQSNSDIFDAGELKYFTSVTTLGGYAFNGCTNLERVALPNSITSIGSYAFNGCTNLERVEVESLEDWLKITISEGGSPNQSSNSSLYINGIELAGEVIVPNSITSISRYGFYKLTKITSVVMHDNVTSIGHTAFKGCSSLISITVGKNTKSFGGEVIYNCPSFTTIYFNGDIEDWLDIDFFSSYWVNKSICLVGYTLYIKGIPLTNLVVPQGITEIKSMAFCNNIGLVSVILPNTITTIGHNAFSCDYNVTSNIVTMNIPSSVTSIGSSAFAYCKKWIGDVVVPSAVTTLSAVFHLCANITSITLNEGLVEILGYCFDTMTALRGYFIIPSTVTKIQGGILYHTNYVEGLIIKATTPPSGGGASYGFSKPIYVPDESVEEYKNSTDWSPYANKIHPISELPTNIINNL